MGERRKHSITEAALRNSELTVLGQVPGASNAVFLGLYEAEHESVGFACKKQEDPGPAAALEQGTVVRRAIYKPSRGERPLHDFPYGSLARREAAAYQLSCALGLDIVPPTVLVDGPYGPGSLQAYVLDDDGPDAAGIFFPDEVPAGFAEVLRGETESGEDVVVAHGTDAQLLHLAVFDVVANNADRKGSHIVHGTVIPGAAPRYFAIDNGLSFHADTKLRTILWGFAGREVPAKLRQALTELADTIPGELEELLSPAEADALVARSAALAEIGKLPHPPADRYPIPWPPM